MPVALRHSPSFSMLKQISTLLGLAMIGLLWLGLYFQLASERASTLQTAEITSGNLSRAFEEHVVRAIKELDEALILLRATHERYRIDWQSLISSVGQLSDLTSQVSVIDKTGRLEASNVAGQTYPSGIGTDLSDREHFQVHVNSAEDKLFIGKPLLGRISQAWTIQLTRPIRAANGSFDGVLVMSLDPRRIAAFYQSIDIGANGVITLMGTDGIIRARASRQGEVVGTNIRAPDAFRSQLTAGSGSFTSAEPIDGVSRIFSYRAVRKLPLIVTIGLSESDVLQAYNQHRWLYPLGGLVLSLLILAAMSEGMRQHVLIDRTQQSLQLSEAETRHKSHELEVTLNNMSQGILMVDGDGNVAVMNQQVARLLDLPDCYLSRRLKIGEVVDFLLQRGEYDQDRGLVDPIVLEGLRNGGNTPALAHYERRRPNGTVLDVCTKELTHGGFVRTFTDITERKQAEARMAFMAEHDALTGLPNRVRLKKELERVLAHQQHYGNGFAVLYLDLDQFKQVNDTLGHPVGDALLCAVAERLKNCIRETDTLARLGGDEFALLQFDAQQINDSAKLAGRIIEAISAPYQIHDHQIRIGVSIGIAMAPQDGREADQLIRNADLALYRAKEDGRGKSCFFEPGMDAKARHRRELEIELRQALENSEFELYYQPIVHIDTSAVVGFEALLRWPHATRGMIPPMDFIPLAEEIGLILPLGEWVLRQACKMAATLPEHIKMAVNLSPAQFKSPKLAEMVTAALTDAGLAAERLELEITETVLLDDSNRNMETLHNLRRLGVGISLDDFGTGYSSLSYLRTFPFDKIKIDRSFVMELEDRSACAAIVSAVTGLGKNLGMITTAEGVETNEQLHELRAQGCVEAQGYLFGRPRPAEDALAIVAAQQQKLGMVA